MRTMDHRWLLALALAASVGGCSSLLDVDNPNNVPADKITDPTAAAAIVNGALSAVARGVNDVTLPVATVTDELDWVGSRDAWRQLEFGDLSDPFNEFTDAAFPFLAEGRWLADEAIQVLETHRANGLVPTVVSPVLLARAYLYSAIAYTTIGDLFDNWAFSDMRASVAPLGEDNMRQVYDTAIVYLDRGEAQAVAAGAPGNPWRLAILAMRARAKHARAVWDLVGNRPTTTPVPNNGLVNDAGAVADANAALALATGDYKFEFKYSATTVGGDFGAWVNNRQEMRLGDVYVFASASNKTWDSTRIRDPITNARDPALNAVATAFKTAASYPVFTVASRRELHLIVAEGRLAAGDTIGPTSGFATAINAVRGLNSLAAYDPANAAHPRPLAMLQYERQVNLYLQGRRLADMYRWGLVDAKWQPTSEARTQRFRFLPITARECLSNTFIGGANCREP